jgi:tetratricopeptide (TPR) repeat protein
MTNDQAIQLAGERLRSGQAAEAEKACREVLAAEPNHLRAWNLLGGVLQTQGRLDEAIAAFTRVIQIKPDLSAGHLNLGNVLMQKERLTEAVLEYERVIQLKSDSPEAHNRMAIALAALGRFDEALASNQCALTLRPNEPGAHEARGAMLLHKQDAGGAEASFRRALELAPSSAMSWNGLGMALRTLGRFDEAVDCFRRAVAINPDNPHFHKNLVSMSAQAVKSEVVDRLTKLLNQPDLLVDSRVEAGFALGKLFDDAGRFDEAFSSYARANDLFRQARAAAGESYDAEGMRRAVDTMIESFTPEFFASRRQWGLASELPVFIVGMPRSGTSLVEQIAASHSGVFGAGELTDINQISAQLSQGQDRLTGRGWNAQGIAQAAEAHLGRLRLLSASATRVIDKLPGNVLQLGLIAVLFPGARVIFCRRDARDICLSCFFQQFSKKDRQLFIYDLADCGRHYLQVERLTAHWLKVLPLRMIEIQYEDLVADLELHSRRLIDFLGLDWEPACLEFHRTERAVLTSSVWQVRQPIYTRSVARWRHYEKHLGPLLEVLSGR